MCVGTLLESGTLLADHEFHAKLRGFALKPRVAFHGIWIELIGDQFVPFYKNIFRYSDLQFQTNFRIFRKVI